jgi:hypothetical protein
MFVIVQVGIQMLLSNSRLDRCVEILHKPSCYRILHSIHNKTTIINVATVQTGNSCREALFTLLHN